MNPLAMDDLLLNSSAIAANMTNNDNANNATGKSGKSNKKFFSFGKKKPKRKPVCTCHLYMNGGGSSMLGAYGGPLSPLNNGTNSYGNNSSKPYQQQLELAPPTEFLNSPSSAPALSSSISPHHSLQQHSQVPNGDLLSPCPSPKYYNNQPSRYQPSHHQQQQQHHHPSSPYNQSLSISPRHYSTTSPSINHHQHQQATSFMDAASMPTTNQTNSRLDDFIGSSGRRENYYQNSNGTNNLIAQEYCGPSSVVQSMTNLSIGERGTPHHHSHNHHNQWESSGRAVSAQLAYQLELASTTSSRQYKKMLIHGHGSLGNEQYAPTSNHHNHKSTKDDSISGMTGIYGTPDLGSIFRRQQRQMMMETNQQQQQQQMDQMALVPYNANNRQRRWSDGNPAKYSKTDADSYREDQQRNNPQINPELYLPPDPKGYIPNCTCSKCVRHSKNRPKVSFGPSMMYPMNDSNDPNNSYNSSLPPMDPNDPKKTPWSKLTTELLPLDTQIPLQMMSDSALVCTIV